MNVIPIAINSPKANTQINKKSINSQPKTSQSPTNNTQQSVNFKSRGYGEIASELSGYKSHLANQIRLGGMPDYIAELRSSIRDLEAELAESKKNNNVVERGLSRFFNFISDGGGKNGPWYL